MDRLTTDTPKDNIQNALNLFFVKDHEAYVRGGGPAPDYKDVPLNDYMSRIIEAYNLDIPTSAGELPDAMYERLFDGTETMEGLMATLYTAAWTFAEIRESLKRYEDAEEEGRLIVLPCKPGKMAYLVHDLRESEFPSVADITGPYEVYHANLKGFYIRSKRGMTFFVRWHEVGKTAFWSKQKAEAARDAIIAEDANVPTKKEE